MLDHGEDIETRADRLPKSEADRRSKDVTALARELAQLMVDEVLDGRVVFKDRPRVPPA